MIDTISTRLETATEIAEAASDIMRRVANDPEGTLVETASGPVPSIAEWLRQMANQIETLPPASLPLNGNELLQVIQGSNARSVRVADLPSGSGGDGALEEDLADRADPAKGAAKVGYKGSTVADTISVLVPFPAAGATATSFQAWLNLFAGRNVRLEKGAVYSFSQAVTIPKNTWVNSNGATVTFYLDGPVNGFILSEGSRIFNGEVYVVGTNPSGGGDKQAPISGGNQTTGAGIKGAQVRNMKVGTTRPDGNGIVLFGACNDCMVEGIHAPSSSTMARVVALEWGGNITDGTGHPYNNQVLNISAEKMTYTKDGNPSGYVVWASSTFNTLIENIVAEEAPGMVGIFTGDRAAEWAPWYKPLIGANNTVRNVACPAVTAFGIRVYGKGMSVSTPLEQPALIEKFYLQGKTGNITAFGVHTGYCKGVTVQDGTVTGFLNGTITDANVENLTIQRVTATKCLRAGIKVGNSGGRTKNARILDNYAHSNNQGSGNSGANQAGIDVANADNTRVLRNRVGVDVGETQRYGVYLADSCQTVFLEDNNVEGLAAGGACYFAGTATNYALNAIGKNNLGVPGLTPWTGSPLFQYTASGKRVFELPSNAAPTAGNWIAGETGYYPSAAAGGKSGTKCVSPGTPGTWKEFGAIDA